MKTLGHLRSWECALIYRKLKSSILDTVTRTYRYTYMASSYCSLRTFFYRATLQRISRPSKMGRGWPLVICPSSPHVLHCQVRSFYVKQYQRNYGDSSENFDPLRPAFEGHSRSSVPTRIDRRPMTSYSYSAATTGLSRVVSETNGDFSRKLLIFPPRVFKSPLRQLYLELDNTGWP